MADTKPTAIETPEELLEEEIEELERNTLNSGRIWAIAAVGLSLLAGAAFLITWWDNKSQSGKVPTFAPESIRLIEPTGFAFGRDVAWAHPAFADRCVFVRNDKEIVCLSLAK